MGIFSLNWFREKKRELLDLKIEEQTIKNELLEKQLHEEVAPKLLRHYKKLKFINDVLTVILNDGSVLSVCGATVEDFNAVRNAPSEKEIIRILSDEKVIEEFLKQEKEEKKQERIYYGAKSLAGFPDFEIKGDAVYMKGIDRSLPPLLVERFAEIIEKYGDQEYASQDEEYISLKRFFLWCCLNPRAEVADRLYDFLMKNDFKITKQGMFVALRNVVRKGECDHELVNAVTNAYNKVKAVWKKKPSDFIVCTVSGEYEISKVTSTPSSPIVGNLETLYLDLPNMKGNRYTDNYTHTYDIRIGQLVRMDPEKCSWSTADCAEAGLHFAGHTAPYVLCGDTTVFTLHNPMKVVAIGEEKGRCWEYLPFMTSSVDEANEIMSSEDFDFMQLDEQYALDELNGLEEKVKEGFATEAKKHSFNLPASSSLQIKKIVSSLEEMKKEIENRVRIVK